MKRYALALALLLLPSLTFAAKPAANKRLDDAYSRAGFPVWGQTEYITASGEYIPDNVAAVSTSAAEDPNLPKLFHYGTIVMITCDVDALGFFVHDIGVTTATTGAVTDSGSLAGRTTGANGFWIEAGLTRHVIVPTPPKRGNEGITSESQVSVRVLSCEASATGTTADAVYGRPCDSDADCLHSYGVTCTDTNLPKGSYLKIHPTAAAQCSFEVEH
jgi:hypothetical protein